MGDAELSDGPLETGIAIGGLAAIGALAAYEMHFEITSAVVTALAAYIMAKVYVSQSKGPSG